MANTKTDIGQIIQDIHVIFKSDSLFEPRLDSNFDPNKEYLDGELISESDTVADETILNLNAMNIAASKNKSNQKGFYTDEDKTISIYYPSLKMIPDTRYYEEYQDENWYEGHLSLKLIVVNGSGYTALFSGSINARVN